MFKAVELKMKSEVKKTTEVEIDRRYILICGCELF